MKFFLLAPVVGATPFDASSGDGSWQWNPVGGTKCLDGSETGVWVRYSTSASQNFGVYLYGGGACFNTLTCDTASKDPKPANPGSSGIFDSRSDNPLGEYNWMAVPYCSGDVHSGEATTSSFGGRTYNGGANLDLMMARATDTFQDVGTLFVTGESAGGFGALSMYGNIRNSYPQARGVLMDDSGPILDDTALAPCLQGKWRSFWGLNKHLPSDCSCSAGTSGGLGGAWSYLKQTYPNDSVSLVSSVDDSTISLFFAYGLNNCHTFLPIGYNKLHAGLERLADTGVPVFMIPGSTHTHTSSDEFFTRNVSGVALYKWIGQLEDASQQDPTAVRPTEGDYVSEQIRPTTDSHRVIV